MCVHISFMLLFVFINVSMAILVISDLKTSFRWNMIDFSNWIRFLQGGDVLQNDATSQMPGWVCGQIGSCSWAEHVFQGLIFFWWWLQIVIFDGNGIARNFLKGINMTVSIAWKTGYGPWELILCVWIMLVMDLWISRSAWRPKWLKQYSNNPYLGDSKRPCFVCWIPKR